MDRRKAERYTVSLRCFVSQTEPAGQHLTGCIENLSRSGLRIRFDEAPIDLALPEIGAEIEIDVELPRQRPHSRRRSLHCYATVVRSGRSENGGAYFAASICELHFRDLPVRFYFSEAAAQDLARQVV
jgi:hypothetical protein